MSKAKPSPFKRLKYYKSTNISSSAFTLTEILVALLIVIILVSLSIPNFTRPRQAALDKRAKTALMLINAAEKVYYLKMGFYYPYVSVSPSAQVNLSGINSNLRINLSDDNWTFGITTYDTSFYDTFTATASQANPARAFQITREDEEPTGP